MSIVSDELQLTTAGSSALGAVAGSLLPARLSGLT